MFLRRAMRSRGLTGVALSEAAGLHPITFSRILNRLQRPRPTTAVAIAEAIEISVEVLFPDIYGGGRS
jgi:lambda repressor-like predicted transcriptional regulator